MRAFCFLFFFSSWFNTLFCQKYDTRFEYFILNPSKRTNTVNIKLDQQVNSELIAISLKWKSEILVKPPEFTLSYYRDNKYLVENIVFLHDAHLETDENWGTCLPIYIPKGVNEVYVNTKNLDSKIDLMVNIFNVLDNKDVKEENEISIQSNCFCDTLVYKNRSQWDCPDPPRAYSYTDVTHLIVHHAAGTNTSSNWANVVLSIWNFHVNVNGWADIGYNWLIDPNGVLYEGRGGGNNVIGAHFCGKNGRTMGVCMLGNLSTVEPTEAALNTLRKLLFWKSCDNNIAPEGQNTHMGIQLNNISGHRDGCATECPGTFMYPKLASLRSLVRASIDECLTTDIQLDDQNSYFFPNPVKGKLYLSSDILWVKIFDKNGMLILYTSHIPNDGVDLNNMVAGHYLIQILANEGKLTTGKIVITN